MSQNGKKKGMRIISTLTSLFDYLDLQKEAWGEQYTLATCMRDIDRFFEEHPEATDREAISESVSAVLRGDFEEEDNDCYLLVKLDTGAKMPTRAHYGDAGLDLYSMKSAVVRPHTVELFDTGVHVAIPYGFVGLITSRSGLMTKGITSRGTIDSGYRGSIHVALINHTDEDVFVHEGDRISQLVILPCALPEPLEMDELPETERGENGFGSTGQ